MPNLLNETIDLRIWHIKNNMEREGDSIEDIETQIDMLNERLRVVKAKHADKLTMITDLEALKVPE